uniref:Protein-S-isoprenylcysteine O-methyltransferase n=1 Tax=Adineta vaga TaxID=104782 RepID=B3G4E0_ADIVA|nr:putative S-isoprenylcysteine O-methyltransferase-like protein [Adineta vaga]
MNQQLSPVARIIWLLLNILFGGVFAQILFAWTACDMKMPQLIINFISNYLPFMSPLFRVPYLEINSLSSSIWGKLAFDALLYAIFAIAHTVFAQESVQAVITRYLLPKQTLRTAYCVMVSITVFVILGFWQHTHVQLWNWLPTTMSLYQQQFVLLTIFTIIHAPEFSGIKQLFSQTGTISCPFSTTTMSQQRTTGVHTLVTTGLFRFCRHPLYLFTLLPLIITPTMSLDRLAFIVFTCVYDAIGIPIEEKKLVRFFGQSYIDYQQCVPAIIPCWNNFVGRQQTKKKQKQ